MKSALSVSLLLAGSATAYASTSEGEKGFHHILYQKQGEKAVKNKVKSEVKKATKQVAKDGVDKTVEKTKAKSKDYYNKTKEATKKELICPFQIDIKDVAVVQILEISRQHIVANKSIQIP